jgi:hypothetical protein
MPAAGKDGRTCTSVTKPRKPATRIKAAHRLAVPTKDATVVGPLPAKRYRNATGRTGLAVSTAAWKTAGLNRPPAKPHQAVPSGNDPTAAPTASARVTAVTIAGNADRRFRSTKIVPNWRASRPTTGHQRAVSRHGHPFRLLTASVSCGAMVNRSPTTPRSAISKIGASGSLLMATMVLEVCIPARCWIAPEMPSAT